MLLLTISLFIQYDLHSCLHYGKRNFNEDLLMKRHHQNFLQINDFIKEAKHRFHEETSVLGVRDDKQETTRDDKALDLRNTTWWWDNSSFIDQLGLNTPPTFLLPAIRSRPTFPFSITPYTTELNGRHLKWDQIFPDQNARLRSGPEVSSTQLNRSPPQSSPIPSLKGQNSSGSTFHPPIVRTRSRLLLFNTTFSLNTYFKDLDFVSTTTLTPPNKDYISWLREITMYTPVERWMQTLATKVGVSPNYGHTTNRATQVSTPSKPHTSVQNRQLKYDSKDQPHHMLRQGLPVADEEMNYKISTETTKAKFFIVNVDGIFHLRTVTELTEKVEKTTMMISGGPSTIQDDATTKLTPTSARDVLLRERDPKTLGPSYRKSGRFHSKARKRNRSQHSHKRKRTRQIKKQSYRYPKFRKHDGKGKQEVDYPMLRMRDTAEDSRKFSLNAQSLKGKTKRKSRALFSNAVTRSTERKNLRVPTYLQPPISEFISKRAYQEEDNHVKLIEVQDELLDKETSQKDNISVHHQEKESLKAVEEKEEDKRLKAKAELIRKMVVGSSYSYSDEEATLRKNFVEALRYGKRT